MTLEKHVTSLELSKRLKELGVPQKSWLYYWDSGMSTGFHLGRDSETDPSDRYSAFLASELGEMLPHEVGELGGLRLWKRSDMRVGDSYAWTAEYHSNSGVSVMCDGTLADAMAKLLIHIIENKIIDPRSLTNSHQKV